MRLQSHHPGRMHRARPGRMYHTPSRTADATYCTRATGGADSTCTTGATDASARST